MLGDINATVNQPSSQDGKGRMLIIGSQIDATARIWRGRDRIGGMWRRAYEVEMKAIHWANLEIGWHRIGLSDAIYLCLMCLWTQCGLMMMKYWHGFFFSTQYFECNSSKKQTSNIAEQIDRITNRDELAVTTTSIGTGTIRVLLLTGNKINMNEIILTVKK
jgi:hypothetical protein